MKAIVEIPKGSSYKYETDKFSGKLYIDRPLNQPIPHNYGYIPGTLSEDNDPLDVFIIASERLIPGAEVKIEPLRLIKCLDNGVEDDKVVASIKGELPDPKLVDRCVDTIKQFLSTYKDNFQVLEETKEFNIDDYK